MKYQNAKLLTLSLLIACCILAAPAQATIVATKPVYVATDHWTYGDVGVTTEDVTMSITTTSATKNSIACYEVSIAIKTNGTTQNVKSWYRATDFAMVASETSISSGGVTMSVTTVFDPPASAYKYPMKVGDTWTVKQTIRTTTDMPYFGKITTNTTQNITYTITAEEKVTVVAGTFDTLKIVTDYGHGETDVFWYAPKVGSYAKTQSTDSHGTSTTELKEYSFHNAPGGGGGGGNGGNGLGGMMLYGIIGVIGIVVVVIVVLMMVMRKKPAPAQQPPAMQPAQPGQPMATTTQAPPVQPPAQQQVAPQYQQPPQTQAYDPAQYQQPQQQYQQPPQAPAYDPAQYQQPPQQQYQQPPQAPAYDPAQYQQPQQQVQQYQPPPQ